MTPGPQPAEDLRPERGVRRPGQRHRGAVRAGRGAGRGVLADQVRCSRGSPRSPRCWMVDPPFASGSRTAPSTPPERRGPPCGGRQLVTARGPYFEGEPGDSALRTYAQSRTRSPRRRQNVFEALGVGKGDRVAVQPADDRGGVITMLARAHRSDPLGGLRRLLRGRLRSRIRTARRSRGHRRTAPTAAASPPP
ncbi:hypothetical protein QJS66_18625 [Kocuria rhizophila]|nr:hypothetical protein QJS66_18625 [Kocuria rhizophila]